MKRIFCIITILLALSTTSMAQKEREDKGHKNVKKKITVPAAVKAAFTNKYPDAKKITWEKEKGNYEANWGGRSGEENAVMFTPSGDLIEIVKAIPVTELPAAALTYLKMHYKGVKITEAGRITNAKGETSYEAVVHHKDVIFDEKGNFVKAEK